jgi:hypothetical protein
MLKQRADGHPQPVGQFGAQGFPPHAGSQAAAGRQFKSQRSSGQRKKLQSLHPGLQRFPPQNGLQSTSEWQSRSQIDPGQLMRSHSSGQPFAHGFPPQLGVQRVIGHADQQTQIGPHGLPPQLGSQAAVSGQTSALQRCGQPPPQAFPPHRGLHSRPGQPDKQGLMLQGFGWPKLSCGASAAATQTSATAATLQFGNPKLAIGNFIAGSPAQEPVPCPRPAASWPYR